MSSLTAPSIHDRIITNTNVNSQTISDVWKRRIVIGGIALAVFMGTAALAAGTGSLLSIAGAKLVSAAGANPTLSAYAIKNIGTGLIYAGNGLFLGGKYAFLSVAVPTYTLGWILPKWIITKGAPQVLQLANNYVLIPIFNGIVKTSAYISVALTRVAQRVYENILIPLIEHSWKLMEWTWNHVIVPSAERAAQAAHWIADRVLKPLFSSTYCLLERAWHAIVIPFARKISESLSTVKEVLIRMAIVIYNNVITPFQNTLKWSWNAIILPAATKIYGALVGLSRALDATIQTLYTKIVVPIANAANQAHYYIKNAILIPIIDGIVKSATYIKDVVATTAQAIYDYALVPIANAASRSLALIWDKVIIPSYEVVKITSQVIFENCIIPLAKISHQFLVWSWNSVVMPVVNGIIDRSHYINQQIANIAQAIYDYVVLPIGRKILEYHDLTVYYGGILYAWTTDAISNIFQTVLNNSQAAMRSVQNTYQWIAERL